MKQSSIEWLQQALEDTILTHEQIMQTIGLFEQAKEIEKQQIMDAWIEGGEYGYLSQESDRVLAEQYYNETFNIKEK
jgi:hypothetical protein